MAGGGTMPERLGKKKRKKLDCQSWFLVIPKNDKNFIKQGTILHRLQIIVLNL